MRREGRLGQLTEHGVLFVLGRGTKVPNHDRNVKILSDFPTSHKLSQTPVPWGERWNTLPFQKCLVCVTYCMKDSGYFICQNHLPSFIVYEVYWQALVKLFKVSTQLLTMRPLDPSRKIIYFRSTFYSDSLTKGKQIPEVPLGAHLNAIWIRPRWVMTCTASGAVRWPNRQGRRRPSRAQTPNTEQVEPIHIESVTRDVINVAFSLSCALEAPIGNIGWDALLGLHTGWLALDRRLLELRE